MLGQEHLLFVEYLNEEGLGEAEDLGPAGLEHGKVPFALMVCGIFLEELYAVCEFGESWLKKILKHFPAGYFTGVIESEFIVICIII